MQSVFCEIYVKQERHPPPLFILFCIRLLDEMRHQCNFCKPGTQIQQCRDPHPGGCARSTDGNGTCSAGNITGTYRCRQRSTNCLERSNDALCRILVFQDVTPLTQLNKAGSATLIQANADNA